MIYYCFGVAVAVAVAVPVAVYDNVVVVLVQMKRQKIYGDVAQNATREELEELLVQFDNHMPSVIKALETKIREKGVRYLMSFYLRNVQTRVFYPFFKRELKIINAYLPEPKPKRSKEYSLQEFQGSH